jgi:hypothetical protein
MRKLFNAILAAMPIVFAAMIFIPSTMIMTGCDDPVSTTDTLRIVDTLSDTLTDTLTDTLSDTLTDTLSDTVTILDSSYLEGMKIIRDSDIDSGETLTLNKDTVYQLDGFVFVENTALLVIPAGTVIKAKSGGGLNASALIICRGGKIDARGTAALPIIFTAQQDNIAELSDLTQSSRGLWGGIILLGRSITSRIAGEEQIEGITADDSRGLYGGSISDDSSGVMQYVSIRYAGSNIGEGNEINGLTMGAVGSKTVIDHIEVYNNNDDGYEWFGGTVNCKYLISAGSADDSYDWDEGFRGKGQFWLAIQDMWTADRTMECDGNPSDNLGNTTGFSKPTLYNVTLIGSGATSKNNGNMALKLREETGLLLHNSIITGFPGDLKVTSGTVASTGVINIDNEKGNAGNLVSDHMLTTGDLVISKNLFFGFGYGMDSTKIMKFSDNATTPTLDAAKKAAMDSLVVKFNLFSADPLLTVTRGEEYITAFDPIPSAGSPALTWTTGMAEPADGFFTDVSYCGAFNAGDTWHTWAFCMQAFNN